MKTFTAIATATALVLGVFAVSAQQSDANAHGKKALKKHSHYASKTTRPQVRGYLSRGGGYAYGYDYQRPLYQGLYGRLGYSTDLTFWERVNSDPRSNSNEVSPSGF